MSRDVIKNFILMVDGRGYAGDVEDYTPPKLTLKTEEFRGAGADAPTEIDMGMEKLETSFTLLAYNKEVLGLFGLTSNSATALKVRGAIQSADGTVTAIVHTLRGRIKECDQGTFKPGDKPAIKFTVALTYYKLEHGGAVVHEIDPSACKRVINGTDQLAEVRAAMGI